ncbi:hypothetical protein D8M04_04115 [Oceanobacillus piezotolerans]|uniref:DUF3994 domain-containing protein n=1 Tax=Oceanobacillus piezotolerans TaxID=2448030 RepID=A0A498DBF2_9BACI|nr:hypothetical protein [Oceanobacillus piezotolerans]RLL48454.1 hypothetical protein D8M04_04115 [Oceanobacillus piezotolerans]
MKKQTYKLFVIALFTLMLLLIAGCTGNAEQETQDENIETIESLLQNALTGPNDELKKIFNSGEIGDLVQYDKDHFEDYFANEASYMEFVNNNNSSGILIEALKNDYNFKVENIEYEKTESDEIIYDFTLELHYQKESSESLEVETVSGQANLNEEHKIEDILIRLGDFLGSLSN